MEQQKKMVENEHLTSLEKLKEREEEIRQLHKVRIVTSNCFPPENGFPYNYYLEIGTAF